jgi:hypothetical protein
MTKSKRAHPPGPAPLDPVVADFTYTTVDSEVVCLSELPPEQQTTANYPKAVELKTLPDTGVGMDMVSFAMRALEEQRMFRLKLMSPALAQPENRDLLLSAYEQYMRTETYVDYNLTPRMQWVLAPPPGIHPGCCFPRNIHHVFWAARRFDCQTHMWTYMVLFRTVLGQNMVFVATRDRRRHWSFGMLPAVNIVEALRTIRKTWPYFYNLLRVEAREFKAQLQKMREGASEYEDWIPVYTRARTQARV